MIIKFEDYINEDLLFTDNLEFSTHDLPLIDIHKYYMFYYSKLSKIINTDDIEYDGKKYDVITYYDNLFSIDLFREALYKKIQEFFKNVITPYFRKMNIGIKNLIPDIITDQNEDEKFKLNFDMRISKDFYQNILNLLNSNIIEFSDENINNYWSKKTFIKNLENIINGNIKMNWTFSDTFIPFLKYMIRVVGKKREMWQKDFEEFLINDESLKDPYQYIKKELK